MATEARRGGAELQGELWGAGAARWAEQEDRQRPIYEEVLTRAGAGEGSRLLDVGCGSGAALQIAVGRGARVAGLDASVALIELARVRVPGADLRVGDLQRLPFEDASFDVVTGFNSFQFADDVIAALREAARVVTPGGHVAVQVWGRADRCQSLAVIRAIGPFLPGPVPGPPGGGNYSDPGVLEALVTEAGLRPEATGDVVCTFEYTDREEVVRTTLAAGMAELAVRSAGEAAVRAAVEAAVEPYETADASYRFENEWHYLIAAA